MKHQAMTDVPMSDQMSEVPPELVSKKFWEVTLNGPPSGPKALKPVAGRIPRPSGVAQGSDQAYPVGVPQPVQRS